jgi:hypothetical protein
MTREQLAKFEALAAEENASFLVHRRAWKTYKWHRNALRRGVERVSPATVTAAYDRWIAKKHTLREVRLRMLQLRKSLGLPLWGSQDGAFFSPEEYAVILRRNSERVENLPVKALGSSGRNWEGRV